MPTKSQHHVKARHNAHFLAAMPTDGYPDWVAVVAFYTAVHLVEMVRAAAGHGHSTGHEDRLTYVQHEHPDVHTPYHLLQNVSMLARYKSNADFYEQFQPEDVRAQLLDGCLSEVQQYALGRTGLSID